MKNDKKKEIQTTPKMNRRPKGVFPARKKNGEVYYRASLTYKRKHISLGSYSDRKSVV